MIRTISLLALTAALAGCATVTNLSDRIGLSGNSAQTDSPADPFVQDAPPVGEATLPPATTAVAPPAGATSAEALDTTTPEQRAAAAAPASGGETVLGKTVVSLGAATEPGLWLKTPLVDAEAQGRVTNPANGQSSQVTLIPSGGPSSGGSQLSLSAMRLIGLPLTELSEVEVAREG